MHERLTTETDRGSAALLGHVMVGLLLVAACSGEPVQPTVSTTVPADSTTVASSTTRQVTTPSTTTMAPDATGAALAAWDAFWVAWAQVRASDDLNPAPLDEVAAPSVVDGAIALFEGQRDSGGGPVPTEVATNPKVAESEADVVRLEDCVLLEPSFTEAVGVWYEATLRSEADHWKVESLRVRSTDGCVPAAMADASIEGYEAYYEAAAEFWNPPDPAHPLINEVLAEPRRSNVRSLLEDHASKGLFLVTEPVTHPEVTEVRSSTELVILDCYFPAATDGLFESSGDLAEGEEPVAEGQRNLRSAVMVFEDGRWKSSDFQGQVDLECDVAPTNQGLPAV